MRNTVATSSKQVIVERSLATGGFLRLPQIIGPYGLLPIGRSTWWEGVRSGRFPAAVKLGPRITAWRCADIAALLNRLESQQ